MYPIILDLANLKIALVGGGDSALSRLKALDAVGAPHVRAFADNFGKDFWDRAGARLVTRMPNDEELRNFTAVLVVDVTKDVAIDIANRARALGVMVNVEGMQEYCDFFYPNVVRRGDLIITVSTSGQSPTLSKRIRNIIAKIFPRRWSLRVEEITLKRKQWQDIGLDQQEIVDMSNKYIDEKRWLEYEELVGSEKQET